MNRDAQLISEFTAEYPFKLDTYQEEAIGHLSAGLSVLVAAPTGTGKTVIAEFGVHRALRAGMRAIYTTPIKALSNQKFRDFRRRYEDQVGLMTGDTVENPDARVLVMTTEVLRNILLQTPDEINDVGCVVFDEVHYLSDAERGTVWEEAIICCPEHVQLVCLSATVANAADVAAWLSAVHGRTELVYHEKRTVPLEHYYYLDGQLTRFIDAEGRQIARFPNTGGEARQGLRADGWREQPANGRQMRTEPSAQEILGRLSRDGLLPCIYFLFSRRETEVAAEECAGHALVDALTRGLIADQVQKYLGQLAPEDRRLRQVQSLAWLLPRGIAFHHAGMLPILKVLVEELFNSGLIGVVFATDTLALGVNMPAKTVVIGAFTKYDGESRRPLIPNEYQQLTGRAGRRGMDERGIAVVPYSPWISFDDVARVARGELLPIRSAFNLRYNTVLNLWTDDGEERVVEIATKSLRQFQLEAEISKSALALASLNGNVERSGERCLLDGTNRLDEYDDARRLAKRTAQRIQHLRRACELLNDQQYGSFWERPAKGKVRLAMRSFTGGELFHSRSMGWGAFVRRLQGVEGGVALALFGDRVAIVDSYADVDYLPSPRLRIDLPAEITAVAGPVNSARDLVHPPTWSAYESSISQLAVPDLAALREQRALELAPRVAEASARLQEAEARLRALDEGIQANPCHNCQSRARHRERRREQAELKLRQEEIRKSIDRLRKTKRLEISRLVKDIGSILDQFGYLNRGRATHKAAMLRDVFDGNGLIICEMISRRLLARCSPAEVAEVFSWFAYDRELPFPNRHSLTRNLLEVRDRLATLEAEVLRAERKHRIALSTSRNPSFYGVAYAWASGASFEGLLDKVGLAEGDIIIALNKTLDLLRQVRDMLRRVDGANPLLARVCEAETLLRRGIVEQCYLLATPAVDAVTTHVRTDAATARPVFIVADGERSRADTSPLSGGNRFSRKAKPRSNRLTARSRETWQAHAQGGR